MPGKNGGLGCFFAFWGKFLKNFQKILKKSVTKCLFGATIVIELNEQ